MGDAYELIAGELIPKAPKSPKHMRSISRLTRRLQAVFGFDFVLQGPTIDVSSPTTPLSRPEPDAAVLTFPADELEEAIRPEQIRLLVEVSDTSFAYDVRVKGELYARAGIVEYWVVDINGQRVIVHRQPSDGRYDSIVAYAAGESVTPLAAANGALRVVELF